MVINPELVAGITESQSCGEKCEENHQPAADLVQVNTRLVMGSHVTCRHDLHQATDCKRYPHYDAVNINRNELGLSKCVFNLAVPWISISLFGLLLLLMRLHLLSKSDLHSIMVLTSVIDHLISLKVPCITERDWRVQVKYESIL